MTYLNDTFFIDLKDKFQDFIFGYGEIEYGGKLPIFYIHVKAEEDVLAQNWAKITDFIAVHFQTTLNEEFAVWNIYLFFITKKLISKELRFKIENDTFSSRKIVIEEDISNTEIINEHILNKDLSMEEQFKSPPPSFTKNRILSYFLDNVESDKRKTQKHEDIFEQILSQIKQNSL